MEKKIVWWKTAKDAPEVAIIQSLVAEKAGVSLMLVDTIEHFMASLNPGFFIVLSFDFVKKCYGEIESLIKGHPDHIFHFHHRMDSKEGK
jgi:hypothetical protein